MPDHSTDVIPSGHKVKLILRGFIVTQITHGNDSALIGALDPSISSCHQPKIQVYQVFPPSIDAPGGKAIEIRSPVPDPANDFFLTVSPTPRNGIQVYQKDEATFQRHDERHNSRKDFRWYLDLSEIHEQPIKLDLGKLHPKLTINKGLFHTSARSDGELRVHPRNAAKPLKHFGKFASEITARVYLDRAGDTAAFINGGNLIFTIRNGDPFSYDIVYDCGCLFSEDENVSDFPLLYGAVTNAAHQHLPYLEQVSMEQDDPALDSAAQLGEDFVPLFSPEVYCMGGNGGG